MSVELASMLREGTKKSHTMAENVGFVKCFLKGVVEKNSYRKLTANLYFVYSAMEEELQQHLAHPVVGRIRFTELDRKNSLERDLAFFYGPDWRDRVQPSEAGQAYIDRIRELSATRPELLVAHSYTRYLGDLSGGQILKGIAQNAMNLDGQGTAFYEFEAIDDEKAYKDMYRATLNSLPIDRETAEAIVAEANNAFRANMKMFEELEGNLIKSIGIMLFNSLTRRNRRNKRSGGTELATAE